MCDNQTLCPRDLLEAGQVNTKYQGEIYSVKYNEQLRFYYLSNQQPDEAWIMISFDSLHGKALDKVSCKLSVYSRQPFSKLISI